MHPALVILTIFAVLPLPAQPVKHSDPGRPQGQIDQSDTGKQNSLHHWPQWRGPLNTGVAPNGNPPVTWSESKNIHWKIAIPGLGHSTPIVWGDTLYLTTAIPFGEIKQSSHKHHHHSDGAHDNMPAMREQKFVIIAVNRTDGSIRWQKTVHSQQPHEDTHETGSWASNSPVTDGERVYAYFGSIGLYCLTMDGQLLWQKDFGDMQTYHGHGEGSSPALHGDTIVINWDHQEQSFLIALDKITGKQRWKIDREEITSWSTPLIVEHDGTHQVIVSATNRTRAYDLKDGKVIWECGGLSRNVVASPVAADGFVYVANSYDWQAMMAIRLADAKGDITNTDVIVWTLDRHTPYVPSPLLYDDHLYFLKHLRGLITCVRAKTGRVLFGPQRLTGIHQVFASPVGAAGKVYIVSRNGVTVVIKHGDQFELLANNLLDDSFSASPVIIRNELYLRGEKFLYCIAEKD